MSIAMAYITVILVWTTTPLGVTWSTETLDPTVAALVRMALAGALGWLLLRAMGKSVCWSKPAIQKYLCADIGIALSMYTTYQAAGLIPSGLISVVYGLSPIMSAIFAQWILKDSMPVYRWIASVVALFGLIMIFGIDVEWAENTVKGVSLLLLSVTLFSLSGVLIKRCDHKNGHFEQTVGALILSVPIYAVIFLIETINGVLDVGSVAVLDSALEGISSVSDRTLASIVYLALMGSLVGFMCYFYILSALRPSTVALVTLVTPVLALLLGILFNGETVTSQIWLGTSVIMLGLVLFNWGDKLASASVLVASKFYPKRSSVRATEATPQEIKTA